MRLILAWIDLYKEDKTYGFGLCQYKDEDKVINKNLLGFYYNDKEVFIDFLWMRVCTTYIGGD